MVIKEAKALDEPALHPPPGNARSRLDSEFFLEYGRQLGREAHNLGIQKDPSPPDKNPIFVHLDRFRTHAGHAIQEAVRKFHQGRYNRSAARLPENLTDWQQTPDIDNPGADLANWPNSAFTLPRGHTYLEMAPFGYLAATRNSPQQFNMEFLLRHGITDDIEIRVFGNGPTYTAGHIDRVNFAPLGFDTKIQCWTEKENLFLPAMGFELYLLTEWLGNTNTNSGTQPGFSLNFDSSLPLDIDFEYNIGAFRDQNSQGSNRWNVSFQWAFQREIYDSSLSLFIHGYINSATIPRMPPQDNNAPADRTPTTGSRDVVGGGLIWTVTRRLSLWGQISTGLSGTDASLLSYAGFATAF